MLDWQGNLVDAKDRKTILLEDIQEEKLMAAALCVGSIEMKAIGDIFDDHHLQAYGGRLEECRIDLHHHTGELESAFRHVSK